MGGEPCSRSVATFRASSGLPEMSSVCVRLPSAAVAMMVGQLISLKYSRDDELESDKLGVRFLVESGYDPRAMIRVMEILAEASGGGQSVEFFQTHPNPERRIEKIEEAIKEHEGARE